MSACAQLIIAFVLILLQLGIIVALLIIEPPQVCVSLEERKILTFGLALMLYSIFSAR